MLTDEIPKKIRSVTFKPCRSIGPGIILQPYIIGKIGYVYSNRYIGLVFPVQCQRQPERTRDQQEEEERDNRIPL